jgi:glycosyltransferase involved in cell wall biosynthesis
MNIAVLLPLFNCQDTVNQTLDSLLKQTYSDFTIYAINNKCTDSTIDIVNSKKDCRIKILNFFETQMCSAALNFGLTKIKEKYVCRADGDDVYHKDYIKTYLNTLLSSKAKVVYGSYRFIKKMSIISDTKSINDKDLLIWRMLFFNTVDHNVMYDLKFIQDIGMYNYLPHSEDYDLWHRCILEDINSIIGTDPSFYSCDCNKTDTCMTEIYKNINNLNISISKNFIKKFLNVDISNILIKKIKNHEKICSKELYIMNNLLTIYLKKMNISNKKFLQNKSFFQFYV